MFQVMFCLVVAACVIAVGQASPATQLNCDGPERAEVLPVFHAFTGCDTVSSFNGRDSDVTQCTVSNVDITPCAAKSRCRLKTGRNATINFDFSPDFSATELETEVTYLGVPFSGLERNACLFTTCPVSKGATQTLSYNLYVQKKLPAGLYTIKWKVWDKADPAHLCCFQTKIELRK